MKKAEMISAIAARSGAHATVVDDVLNALAEVVKDELKSGGELIIPGIAKMGTRDQAARDGRNPATGEAIKIPAKTVVTAKPVTALKDAVA